MSKEKIELDFARILENYMLISEENWGFFLEKKNGKKCPEEAGKNALNSTYNFAQLLKNDQRFSNSGF